MQVIFFHRNGRKTIFPLKTTLYEFIRVRNVILYGLNIFLLLDHRTIQGYLNVVFRNRKGILKGGLKL